MFISDFHPQKRIRQSEAGLTTKQKTDVHCHILPAIDDGSRSKEESLAMLQRFSELGYTDIICTSHYISGSPYVANETKRSQLIRQLQLLATQNHIKIKLHLGNEVYVDPEICDFIENRQASLINKNYLLFELPLNNEINFLDKIVARIQNAGYTPILAHPERYTYFQKHLEKYHELSDLGLALQCNYGSILGLYGEGAQKAMEYMLKNKLVILLGTDAHRPNNKVLLRYREAEQAIIHLIGAEAYQKLINNANYLLQPQA